MSVTREAVIAALSQVEDPELRKDLVTLGMIQDVAVEGSLVSFRVVLTTPACPLKRQIEESARAAVAAVPGVTDVRIKMDASVPKSRPHEKAPLPGIKNIIAVASGKGGVGKSTVSVNLALSLARSGAKVGILDADIYGPNVHIMLGLSGRAPVDQELKKILPMEAHGVKAISMGILMPEGAPVIWRGPLVGSAIKQLLQDVHWGELDYLVVDLPPGTGDAQLSLTQLIPLAGVVIVTTPQEVSLSDATRAIAMFDKVNVPIFGIIENMSSFICPHCDGETEMFGSHGVRRLCDEKGYELLGEIPLDPQVWAGGNGHGPVVSTHPESASAKTMVSIAEAVAAAVSRAALETEDAQEEVASAV